MGREEGKIEDKFHLPLLFLAKRKLFLVEIYLLLRIICNYE